MIGYEVGVCWGGDHDVPVWCSGRGTRCVLVLVRVSVRCNGWTDAAESRGAGRKMIRPTATVEQWQIGGSSWLFKFAVISRRAEGISVVTSDAIKHHHGQGAL